MRLRLRKKKVARRDLDGRLTFSSSNLSPHRLDLFFSVFNSTDSSILSSARSFTC